MANGGNVTKSLLFFILLSAQGNGFNLAVSFGIAFANCGLQNIVSANCRMSSKKALDRLWDVK